MTHNKDRDDDAKEFPEPGSTLDRGRIVVEQHLRGALWTGRADRRPVLIGYSYIPYKEHRNAIDDLYRFDVPGIANLEYLGFPDDGGRKVALVEARPEGDPISELKALTLHEVVQCGIGLCDTILAWGGRRKTLLEGFRPETIYMTNGRLAGVTPRVALIAGEPDDGTFSSARYTSPSDGAPLEITVDDAGFIVAQVMWFALLREHPYQLPNAPDERYNIWDDRRRPFTGPPELGRILEAVLVADPDRRLGVRGFRDQLAALATSP
jgi:hypothetical protein